MASVPGPGIAHDAQRIEPAEECLALFVHNRLSRWEHGMGVVDAADLLWPGGRQPLGYGSTDIFSIDDVLANAELLGDELVDGVSHGLAGRHILRRHGGEGEAWQRRGDDVHLRKRVDQREHLDEGVWPAVEEHHDRSVLIWRSSAHRMHPHPTNVGGELRVPVDPRLRLPPVELVQPVVDEAAEVAWGDPSSAIRTGGRPCEARALQPLTEVAQDDVIDPEGELVHDLVHCVIHLSSPPHFEVARGPHQPDLSRRAPERRRIR